MAVIMTISKVSVRLIGLALLGTLLLSLLEETQGAVASHHHHNTYSDSPSREKESDGAYSSRDASHYEGDDGQQEGHRSEFDHEAILGSAKEAEEFDNLAPEEAKKRLKVLIQKMDENNDEHVDKQELQMWILRSFRMLSEEESNERLQEVDENEDGLLSWGEYVEETYGLNSDQLSIPLQDADEERMLREDQALFDTADKNKDGYLDEEEHLAFTHPEEDPAMLPVIYEQTLDNKDMNGDGFIDFIEFIGDRGKGKGKEWLEGEKEKFDDEFDRDKDGLLNRQEVLSWVVPSNEEIAVDEVTHLFASSDDDQDDLLSFHEILEHHDIFVGSEATDYGDHLHNLDRFREEL